MEMESVDNPTVPHTEQQRSRPCRCASRITGRGQEKTDIPVYRMPDDTAHRTMHSTFLYPRPPAVWNVDRSVGSWISKKNVVCKSCVCPHQQAVFSKKINGINYTVGFHLISLWEVLWQLKERNCCVCIVFDTRSCIG